jgi:ABC-2 type transport system ATP-binding protein
MFGFMSLLGAATGGAKPPPWPDLPTLNQANRMIETRDLTKMYGDLYALNRLTLKLEKGDVYGFIGPNGAGKTTTMRILATLLNPTWGEASVCGYSIYNGAKDIRRLMGYMPDFFGVYDDMKVIEYLEFFAAAYRIQGAERRKKCEQVLELVDLGYKRDALVTSLSRGMTQRLGLARVLLHEPQVLLLDEPASGLDPRARIEMRGLLKELRSMGKTILVSSHILPELADICNKIGIIERGQLLFNGTVQDAIQKVRQHTIYQVAVGNGLNAMARDQLKSLPGVLQVEGDSIEEPFRVTLADANSDGSFLAETLVKNGFRLKTFKEEEIDLEDVFMRITQGITN